MAKSSTPAKRSTSTKADVASVLAWLKDHAQAKVREEMGPRYGIVVKKAFGVRMADMQRLARTIGTDHALAAKLWEAGWYEARMVACMIDDPAQVTPAQMDAWCADFDNWGIVDTVCFKLFDRVPHAFSKVKAWARREQEFEKRAAFALLACLALHDQHTADKVFIDHLPLIEKAASDERNFVKKGVAWALRAMCMRGGATCSGAVALAEKLAASTNASERWIGKDVLRTAKIK